MCYYPVGYLYYIATTSVLPTISSIVSYYVNNRYIYYCGTTFFISAALYYALEKSDPLYRDTLLTKVGLSDPVHRDTLVRVVGFMLLTTALVSIICFYCNLFYYPISFLYYIATTIWNSWIAEYFKMTFIALISCMGIEFLKEVDEKKPHHAFFEFLKESVEKKPHDSCIFWDHRRNQEKSESILSTTPAVNPIAVNQEKSESKLSTTPAKKTGILKFFTTG